MKTMMKRTLAMMMAVSLSITPFSTVAFAAEETPADTGNTVTETTTPDPFPNSVRQEQSETVEVTPDIVEKTDKENAEEAENPVDIRDEQNAEDITENESENNEAVEGADDQAAQGAAAETASKDWSGFYDSENETYQLTYKISKDAEGDQVIVLSKALDLLSEYAEAAYEQYTGRETALENFLEYVKDDNSKSLAENALAFLEKQGLDTSDEYVQKYADYMVDSADYIFVRDNLPSYYLNWYFPNGNPLSPVLNNDQAKATTVEPGDTVKFSVKIESESGHIYSYKDGSFVLVTPELSEAETGVYGFDGQELPEDYLNDGVNRIAYLGGDAARVAKAVNAMDGAEEIDVESLLSGPIEVLVYRAQLADCAKQTKSAQNYYGGGGGTAYTYQKLSGKLDVDQIYALYSLSNSPAARATMTSNQVAVANYLKENGYGEGEKAYKAYLVAYYSEKDGKDYEDFDQLLAGSSVVKDLKQTGNYILGSIELPANTDYNNFYNNLLSYAYGQDAIDALGDNDSWGHTGNELTVGDYMVDMTGEQAKAWKVANEFFQVLLGKGISREEASQVAFNMAFNIDGFLTGNDYQLTQWAGYNSITLEQMDGELIVNKVDEKGDLITTDEAEFKIWYEDENGESQYLKGIVDAEGNIKYSFSEEQSTVSTTGGILDVAYTLVKNLQYYVQEVKAPAGYNLDSNVKVIEVGDMGKTFTDAAGNLIQGMVINFENTVIVVPPTKKHTDPTPDPEPVPENVDIPEENVPMAGPEEDNPEDITPADDEDIVDEEVPLADPDDEVIEDVTVPTTDTPAAKTPAKAPAKAAVQTNQNDGETILDEEVPLSLNPKTGDESNTELWLYLSMMALAGMVATAAMGFGLKRREDK